MKEEADEGVEDIDQGVIVMTAPGSQQNEGTREKGGGGAHGL